MRSGPALSISASLDGAPADIGRKAQGLAALMRAGLPVPAGIVIPSTICAGFPDRLPIELPSIIKAVEPLGPDLLVRSSTSIEDGDLHSGAGVFETVSNVRNPDELNRAIRQVVASATSNAAQSYLDRSATADRKIHMSVIIQTNIQTEWSGAIFTTDPVLPQSNMLVVEAYAGDQIHSRKSHAFCWRIDRGKQALEKSLDPAFSNLPPAAVLGRIIRDALAYEKLKGHPQDIEWGIDKEGRHWFFQARPIVPFSAHESSSDETFASFNLRENFPHPPTPLTWSIFQKLVLPGVFQSMGMHGVLPSDKDPQALVAGRPYWRLSPFMRNPLMRPVVLAAIRHLDSSAAEALATVARSEGCLQNLRALMASRSLVRVLWYSSRLGIQSWQRLEEKRRAFVATSTQKAQPSSFEHVCDEMCKWILDNKEPFSMLFAAGIYYALLDYLVRRWSGPRGTTLLPAALMGVETCSTDYATAVTAALQASGREGDEDFRKKLIAHWGHRCWGECELMTPRLSESFDSLVDLTRNDGEVIEGLNAAKTSAHEQADRAREALKSAVESKRFGKLRWRIIHWLLRHTSALTACREDIKDNLMRRFAALRSHAISLGRLGKLHGIFQEEDDIFFASRNEVILIERASKTGSCDLSEFSSLSADINERRAEWNAASRLPPFDLIVPTRGGIDRKSPKVSSMQLSGAIACPGRVTGKAYVAREGFPSDPEKNCILVLEAADAGCLPWILHAKGLIIEYGGVLSHVAVIAREFGIPALVNVHDAVQRIAHGSALTLDASTGIVVLHPEQAVSS